MSIGGIVALLLMIRCTRCFCCPHCSTKLIAVSAEQGGKQVEWKCYGCEWKSSSISLTAGDASALTSEFVLIEFTVAKTSEMIDKETTRKETVMNMAAECVRFELGIKEMPTPSPYSILLEEETKPWKDIQDRHKDILDKQKAVELSLNQPVASLPTYASLLSKRTVKCSECSKKGVFGLLCKPQVQPLIGDSSLYV